LHQRSFEEILDGRVKPVGTPMELTQILHRAAEKEKEKSSHLPYQCLLGSLMYLAICTRPDIAHVKSVLSQINTNFTEEHWKAAKRALIF
jgi:hypothetical protein